MPALRPALVALLFFSIPYDAVAAVPQSERDVLIAFHQSTSGGSWTRSDGWLGAAGTECDWFGVVCSDEETSVIALELPENNLAGEIPASIAGLARLTRLNLNGNLVSGELPPSIGSLADLEVLDLSNNAISGPLPASIGLLSRLVSLSMNENRLENPLPSSIGQLAELQELLLSGNQFSGPLPGELFQLPLLERVSFERNALTGGIAPFVELDALVDLNLALNQFSGEIPRELAQLDRLESLVLAGNQLTGEIPSELGAIGSLRTLDLSLNSLQGEIPPQLGNLSNLTYLALSSARLTGSIPPQLANLQELTFLDLSANSLTGPIPPVLGQLAKLEFLYLFTNELSGAIPASLTDLSSLRQLLLNQNRLTGTVPPSIGNLTALEELFLGENDLDIAPFPIGVTMLNALRVLDLSGNRFEGPIPQQIGLLTQLEFLSLNDNRFSGGIPPELFQLSELVQLRLDGNELSGPIPANIASMQRLEGLDLSENRLEGAIPPELGNMESLLFLFLGANRFEGTIPAQLGQLSNLLVLTVDQNRLTGPVPSSITGLASLTDGQSSFGYNRLFTSDAAVRDFLNQKQSDGDFELTQTIPPTQLEVSAVRGRAAILSWIPIRYNFDEGGYRITASRSPGGAPVVVTTTAIKDVSSALVEGLDPSTQYFFTIRTVTYPHDTQQNELVSEELGPVGATTLADVPIPPLVVVTARPTGMIQREGEIEKADALVLANFGDLSASVTLTRGGSFFELDQSEFAIEPGDSVFVNITPVPQPPGVYDGTIGIAGTGVSSGLSVPVTLLSTGRASGEVVAVPSATRVDVSADLGGSIRFDNVGTSPLAGLVTTDSAWIRPLITGVSIPPQSSAVVDFTIDPAARPDGDSPSGSVNGTLSLLYLSGDGASAKLLADAALEPWALPPGVSSAAAQVVHTASPAAAAGAVPPLGPGEVARFIPGVAHLSRLGSDLISDLLIANAFGSGPLSDLRVFFARSSSSTPRSIAVPSLAASAFLQLADAVRTVYGNANDSGSLIVRSTDWNRALVSASLLSTTSDGSQATTQLPVFRSDRSAPPGESFALAGVVRDSFRRTDIFIQETSGQPASVMIEFFNGEGRPVGDARPADSIAAHGFLELIDVVPAGAVSALVSNLAASAGQIAAYALLTDSRTGDAAVVTEWSRFFAYDREAAARIPLVTSAPADSSRRRPARRGQGAGKNEETSADVAEATDVTIFNPDTVEAVGSIRYVESRGAVFERPFRLQPRASLVLRDVASTFTGSRRISTGQLIVDATRGRVSVSARRYGTFPDGTRGSEVPAVEAFSGLRLGQVRIFAGVEDAAPSTVLARVPGTIRSGLVFAENGGASATVRVRILYSTGRSAYATLQSREFTIRPFEVLTVPHVSSALIGALRDRIGDLHNTQIRIEVVSGDGAVTAMLVATENGDGDSVLRLD